MQALNAKENIIITVSLALGQASICQGKGFRFFYPLDKKKWRENC